MIHTCIRVNSQVASLDFLTKSCGFKTSKRMDFKKNNLFYLKLLEDIYELELTYNYD